MEQRIGMDVSPCSMTQHFKFVQPQKMMAAALLGGVSQGPANLGKTIEAIS
jgi:hypothetical protein